MLPALPRLPMNAIRPSGGDRRDAPARQPMSVEGTSGVLRRRRPHRAPAAAAQMPLLDAPRGPRDAPAIAARWRGSPGDGPVTGSAVGRGSPAVTPSSPIGQPPQRVGVARGEQHAASVGRDRELGRQARVRAHQAQTRRVSGATVHSAAPRNTPAGAATANTHAPAARHPLRNAVRSDRAARRGQRRRRRPAVDVDDPDRRVGAERSARRSDRPARATGRRCGGRRATTSGARPTR